MYHFGSSPAFYHLFGRISGNTLDSFGTRCHSKHITCFCYRTLVVGARSGSRPHHTTYGNSYGAHQRNGGSVQCCLRQHR